MSVYSDVVSAVVTQIETVFNVGEVHSYLRFQLVYDQLLNLFKTTISGQDQIRAFIVSLNPNNPIEGSLNVDDSSFNEIGRTYNIKIIAIMGINDANNTESTFLTLCETVMNSLEGKRNLGLSDVLENGSGPCTMTKFEDRQFGSFWCHVAEIDFPVMTQLSVTYD